MHNSSAKKVKALKLRDSGYLLSEIASELKIAKSTSSLWCKGVELDEVAQRIIDKKIKVMQLKKARNMTIIKQKKSIIQNQSHKKEIKSLISQTHIDINHKKLMCALFFLCEGGKDVRGGIQFINSDPVLVATFLTLLRESFELNEDKSRALLHLHSYHDPNKQTRYWSDITPIPKRYFYKPYLKANTGKNIHHNYPGCISIRYHDSSLGKILKMIYTEFGNQHRGVR